MTEGMDRVHVFRLDVYGLVETVEEDGHEYVECIACGESDCVLCDASILNAPCTREQTLPGLDWSEFPSEQAEEL